MEDELHSTDTESPAVAQQVPSSAYPVYIDAVGGAKVLDDPAVTLCIDAGVMAGDRLPSDQVLGDDHVVSRRLPDRDAIRLQVEAAWAAGGTNALQVWAARDGRWRWGSRLWSLSPQDSQDEQGAQDEQGDHAKRGDQK